MKNFEEVMQSIKKEPIKPKNQFGKILIRYIDLRTLLEKPDDLPWYFRHAVPGYEMELRSLRSEFEAERRYHNNEKTLPSLYQTFFNALFLQAKKNSEPEKLTHSEKRTPCEEIMKRAAEKVRLIYQIPDIKDMDFYLNNPEELYQLLLYNNKVDIDWYSTRKRDEKIRN